MSMRNVETYILHFIFTRGFCTWYQNIDNYYFYYITIIIIINYSLLIMHNIYHVQAQAHQRKSKYRHKVEPVQILL